MKKFGQFVFNFFWVLIVGIASVVSSALTGVACMVTIIGIPFGLQHFKFIPLVFAPAGKTVVNHYGSHPVMNTFWLLFGGLAMFILYGLLGCVCIVTLIGIPLGLQLFKIAKFNLAPFGVEIVGDDQYTSKRNTKHDYLLLGRRIVANPDVIVDRGTDGTSITAREYFEPLAQRYDNFLPEYKKYIKFQIIMGIIAVSGLILDLVLSYAVKPDFWSKIGLGFLEEYYLFIPFGFYLLFLFIGIIILNKLVSNLSEFCKLDNKYLPSLMSFYDKDMPMGSIKKYFVGGPDKDGKINTDNVWAGICRELFDK